MSKDKKVIRTTKGPITAVSKSVIPTDYAGWLAEVPEDTKGKGCPLPSS